MKRLGLLLCLVLGFAHGQTTNISGIINTYTRVTAWDSCNSNVTVSSTAGFSVGDIVIIMQMQGATWSHANAASHGNVISYLGTGNYEYHTIASIAGSVITFQFQILRSYRPTTCVVQLIRVPQYVNANVTGILTPQPWNQVTGTGGVLAFDASGTVTLNANIEADTCGFKGGVKLNQTAFSCACGGAQYPSYMYPHNANLFGAKKGEGIGFYDNDSTGGMGKMINAGGGGNEHNSGGAGGGNGGAGGNGGTRLSIPTCFFGPYCRGNYPGIGGASLPYSNPVNQVFLGGGGGAGHGNNGFAQSGGTGGGIIIIRCATIEGNGFNVSARGSGISVPAQGDGSAGGGSGGAILIQAGSYGATVLNMISSGGKGGDNNWGAAASNVQCMGTGGGGGGGVTWISAGAYPGNVITNVSGGPRGAQLGGGYCTSLVNNAVNGSNGVSLTGLVPVVSNIGPGCVMALRLDQYQVRLNRDQVDISWVYMGADAPDGWLIERSLDNHSWQMLESRPSDGPFSWTDEHPAPGKSYYRISMLSTSGELQSGPVAEIFYHANGKEGVFLFPNPVEGSGTITAAWLKPEIESATLQILDSFGRLVYTAIISDVAEQGTLNIPTDILVPGLYFVEWKGGNAHYTQRLVVE